jgi:cyclopropane fatty-acyl-phospholipid synthase-like methyltransferase
VPDPDLRRRFLDERRDICRRRFDTLHAPVYDDRWGGYLNPTHELCVRTLVSHLPRGARVLDAACGTGKYWPMLLDAGLDVVGIDQSQAMLDVALSKHPGIETRRLALQELAGPGLAEFDAVLCIDAIENVGPEDWPGVVAGLRGTLRAGGAAYVTVELPDPDDAGPPDDPDAPLVAGEVLSDGAYHYYPSLTEATDLLHAAGFRIDELMEGDGYAHLLMST